MMNGPRWAIAVSVLAAMGAAAIGQAQQLGLSQQGVAIIGILMAGITVLRELIPVIPKGEE